MDLSRSMGYTYRQELTKFDYSICLAAALCYLMIHQQDPVGLITFDEKIRHSLPPALEADATWATCCRCWPTCSPTGQTDIAHSLMQVAAMLRHASLVMIFSDLLAEPEPVLQALAPAAARRPRRDPVPRPRRGRGPFSLRRHGRVGGARDPRQAAGRRRRLPPRLSGRGARRFATAIAASAFRPASTTCRLDTSMQFDRALTEYLVSRKARG